MNVNRVCGLTVAVAVVAASSLSSQQTTDLPAQDRMLNPNFEEVFSVGSFDGEEWETFGEIGGVAFDAEGNLYIFDRQASRIAVVDAQGNFVREFGQPGEGPGELRSPMAFTVLRDGTTVISDMGHRAYSLFDAEGTFQGLVGMGDGDVIRVGPMQPIPGARAVVSGGGGMSVSMSIGPGGAPQGPTTRPIERIALSGQEAQSAVLVEGWLPPRDDRPQEVSGGGMRISMSMAGPRTFEPGLYAGVLPDGSVVYSDSSAYALKIVGPDGTPRSVLRRALSPRPVTEAMQEAEKERQLAELEEGGGPRMRVITAGPGGGGGAQVSQDAIRDMMRNRVDQLQFYPELPVLRGLSAGWEGTLWVHRRGEEPVGPGPIDLVKPDGQYVGTFAAGATEIPEAFGPDGMAAFTETDEFDVPTVVVRRLPGTIR